VNPTVLVLGALGVAALYFATKPERGTPKDRTGESCNPDDPVPVGYVCVPNEDGDGYHLEKQANGLVSYAPYPNAQAVNKVLEKLGFEAGDLVSFQSHMSNVSRYNLPVDGEPTRETMQALHEAEMLLEQDKWRRP
jgi:hypothetical protein